MDHTYYDLLFKEYLVVSRDNVIQFIKTITDYEEAETLRDLLTEQMHSIEYNSEIGEDEDMFSIFKSNQGDV